MVLLKRQPSRIRTLPSSSVIDRQSIASSLKIMTNFPFPFRFAALSFLSKGIGGVFWIIADIIRNTVNLCSQCCFVLFCYWTKITLQFFLQFSDLKKIVFWQKVADIYKSVSLLPKNCNLQKYVLPPLLIPLYLVLYFSTLQCQELKIFFFNYERR